MTKNITTDHENAPFTILGSALANAYHSDLTLYDVYQAWLMTEQCGMQSEQIEREAFSRFDNAINATTHLREITKKET